MKERQSQRKRDGCEKKKSNIIILMKIMMKRREKQNSQINKKVAVF